MHQRRIRNGPISQSHAQFKKAQSLAVKVVKVSNDENINFQELLEDKTQSYLRDKVQLKEIKKVFADGISHDDPEQTCSIRRQAYCLSLGITPEFLRDYQNAYYQGLLA